MAEQGPSSPPPSKSPDNGAQPLDEVMMAMDVVDTLRHREYLVTRELGEGERKEGLISRLKTIYAGQGIEVPDHILAQGVEALKRDRFVYEPPAPGLSVTLAKLYVSRGVWSKYLAGAIGAFAGAWFGYQALVVWPAERRAEAQAIELRETLPSRLAQLRDRIFAQTELESVKATALSLYDTGIASARSGDRKAANTAADSLAQIQKKLGQEYELRIVSRQGTRSGVWRVPDVNTGARNYYLIVEAIDRGGNVLPLEIRNEETGAMANVSTWGIRVSKQVFDSVGRDKNDDGIIQNNIVATKARGVLDLEPLLPTLGGAITEW